MAVIDGGLGQFRGARHPNAGNRSRHFGKSGGNRQRFVVGEIEQVIAVVNSKGEGVSL